MTSQVRQADEVLSQSPDQDGIKCYEELCLSEKARRKLVIKISALNLLVRGM